MKIILAIFVCNGSLVQKNVKTEKDDLILVFSKGSLQAISGIDGEVMWKKDFASERYNGREHSKAVISNLLFLKRCCY